MARAPCLPRDILCLPWVEARKSVSGVAVLSCTDGRDIARRKASPLVGARAQAPPPPTGLLVVGCLLSPPRAIPAAVSAVLPTVAKALQWKGRSFSPSANILYFPDIARFFLRLFSLSGKPLPAPRVLPHSDEGSEETHPSAWNTFSGYVPVGYWHRVFRNRMCLCPGNVEWAIIQGRVCMVDLGVSGDMCPKGNLTCFIW